MEAEKGREENKGVGLSFRDLDALKCKCVNYRNVARWNTFLLISNTFVHQSRLQTQGQVRLHKKLLQSFFLIIKGAA